MKNNRIILTDINQVMSDMLFTPVLNPLQKEYYALMIKSILLNYRGYEYETYKVLMLIKKLNNLGYSVDRNTIYLDLTQQVINSIPMMSDTDIQTYCTENTIGIRVITFEVKFYNWDDTLLDTVTVIRGEDAAMSNPSRAGYMFTGWDGLINNVHENLSVTAQYVVSKIVAFTDYQGNIIDVQTVALGTNAVPPTVDWENIVPNSWEDYTNIQENRVVCPAISSVDGAAYLYITLTPTTGKSPTFYFTASITGFPTIHMDFGDGTSANNGSWGVFTMAHTYAAYGSYVVKITISSSTMQLGWNAGSGLDESVLGGTGNYQQAVIKCITGANVRTTGHTFYRNINLNEICLNSVENLIRLWSFRGCTSLQSILIPSLVTEIYSYAFYGCSILEKIILRRASVVTLEDINALTGTSANLKIYVPADLVDTYKAATNWITYADKIFDINDLAIT